MDIEKAKKSWEGKGLTEGGLAVIGGWIETLASVGPRYEAYQHLAFCSRDVRGSLGCLQDAIKHIESGKMAFRVFIFRKLKKAQSRLRKKNGMNF